MKNQSYYNKYSNKIIKFLSNLDIKVIDKIEKEIKLTSKKKKKIIICGNGGSLATSSHVAVDLTKNAKIKCINFNEPDLITCFANDFGYENWIKEAIRFYADKSDLLILLSCSGKSKNLVEANRYAIDKGLKVITLTGCNKNNLLNKNKKNSVNLWINSFEYNIIEILHHFILLSVIDKIICDQQN